MLIDAIPVEEILAKYAAMAKENAKKKPKPAEDRKKVEKKPKPPA